MSQRFKLSRRAFLAGLGGTAVALPWLEVMTPPVAHAAGDTNKRLIIGFGGMSLPRLDLVVPQQQAPGFDLPRALQPFANVQDHISVVSGLKIPWDTGSGVPRAGRALSFHSSPVGPLLCGRRSPHTGQDIHLPIPGGATADQIVARAMPGQRRFRSLEYRVQADTYRIGQHTGRISYEEVGGVVRVRQPIAQPSLAHEQLFTGFVADDPAQTQQRRHLLQQDKSILDLVEQRASKLRARLGKDDLQRMERHFDEIRDLENRLTEISGTSSNCALLPHPGPDPVAVTYEPNANDDRLVGYADEEKRARVMADIVHMAIACDLTHAVTLQFTYASSAMSAKELIGAASDFHDLGHSGGTMTQFADGIAWHTRHWAYLIKKLSETDELGGTLLDNTAMVFQFEGGRGYDPESGNPDATHSTENMVALIAGNGSKLKLGTHTVAQDRHPAEVTLTAMRSIGVTDDLGELDTPIGEMLV